MKREAAAARAPRVRTPRRSPDALDGTIQRLMAAAGQTTWPPVRPWRLRVRAGGLELVAERSSRRAVLAGGAALLNVRLALADAGVEPVVISVPDDRPDVLVRVEPGAPMRGRPTDGYLFGELQRHRQGAPQFTDGNLSDSLTAHLVAAVEAERARLVPLGAGWSAEPASAAGLLVTDGDGVLDWLRAGQAMQRLYLTASAAWLAVRCDLDTLEVRHVRERVRRDHCPDGFPQVMLELEQRTAPVT